jgi:AraC-like DNA-binding protein
LEYIVFFIIFATTTKTFMRDKLRLVCLFVGFLLIPLMSVPARDMRFYVYNASNGLADNSAQTIHITKTGRLVITTIGQINFFDGQKFTYIDPSSENLYPLPNYSGNYHLYFDKFHHIWLKNTHNVTCVNLTTERFVDSIEEVFKDFGVKDKALDMFVDQANVVWIMTEQGLYNVELQRYYKVNKKLNLQDLEVYGDQYLMLFYSNGQMDVIDLKSGETVRVCHAYDKDMVKRFDRTSVILPYGKTFFQIRNGQHEGILMKYDVDTWEWKTVLQMPYHLNNFAEFDSLLYIASSYGYWTYDIRTEALEHVEMLQMAAGDPLLTDINAMAFDKQGGLWVGTEKRGLLYARPHAAPFHIYGWTNPRALELSDIMDKTVKTRTRYRNRNVNCVFTDSRGWDWVGTSSGLQLYKNSSDRLPQVVTRNEGLLNNVIHTIIEDKSHNIWVGTSYGICCLFIENGNIRYVNSYNQWDNVPSESFVNGRALLLPNGAIAMQMLDHVIEYNPEQMETITDRIAYEMYPKLIRLMVNGNVIRTGQELDGNVILDKAISRTKEINLNYDQNSLTLTFSAMNYFRPQQTYYRVRINGLTDTWQVLTRYNSGGLVDAQGQLHLPLVSIKPGSYSIEVQTSMLPDKWDSVPYEWIININQPWWRTTGMFVLLGSIILLLVMFNAYFYWRNTNMRAIRNSQEQGIIKRIKTFVERCTQRSELFEPIPEEVYGLGGDPQNNLTTEFMDTMIKMIPLLSSKDANKMTMRELSSAAGMDVQKFYQLITANIYKSPRPLARKLMLEKATEMLETTEKSIAEISDACGFVSPNYFIATFYHHTKMTPELYRSKLARKKLV